MTNFCINCHLSGRAASRGSRVAVIAKKKRSSMSQKNKQLSSHEEKKKTFSETEKKKRFGQVERRIFRRVLRAFLASKFWPSHPLNAGTRLANA